MKRTVAITGNIGAGKSHVCKLFEANHQIPIYNCDDEAYRLLNNDKELFYAMTRIFGGDIYKLQGRAMMWNKEFVVNRILRDKNLYNAMVAILQPFVLKDYMQWHFEQIFINNKPYTIMENAILFETGLYRMFDTIIDIDAPLETRYRRFVERHPDGTSSPVMRNKFDAIIARQIKPEHKEEMCGDTIEYLRLINDETGNLSTTISNMHSVFMRKLATRGEW